MERISDSKITGALELQERLNGNFPKLLGRIIRQLQSDNAALRSGAEIVALESVNNELRGENELLTASNAALRADVERLREALSKTKCPIGLDHTPTICSAGSCHGCLGRRLEWALKENERMTAALGASSSATPRGPIDWRDGPPTEYLQDGQEVLIQTKEGQSSVIRFDNYLKGWLYRGGLVVDFNGMVSRHCPVTP